jgi:hypothetical protein
MKRSGLVVTAFTCALMAPGAADAKKDAMTLQELVNASAIVVVAKVESVAVAEHPKTYEYGWTTHPRTATARVLETWAGGPLSSQTVKFSATKTWTCDESYAEAGETVVLFLGEPGEDGVRDIVNWGEGRLPVRPLGGADYVKLRWSRGFVPSGFSVIEVERPEQGHPDAFLELRAFQKAMGAEPGPLAQEPVLAAPPPATADWLAPTGWPVMGGALVLADVALAALLWRLARRRRRHIAARWSGLLVGSALGAWLAPKQLQLLFTLPAPANEPDIAMVHLIWPITALLCGLLAWVTAEIAAGRSRRPLLGAVGACLGSAVVVGWFIIDPPVALERLVGGFQPLGIDVPQGLLVALGSAIGYQVLRGGGATEMARLRRQVVPPTISGRSDAWDTTGTPSRPS